MKNLLPTGKNSEPGPGDNQRQLRHDHHGFQPILAILAVLLAFGMWVYVRSVVTPYTTVTVRGIPVTFSGEEELREDRSLMLDVVTNRMASVTFYGKRSELAELNRENVYLTVDLSGIRQAERYEMPYTISYEEGLETSSISVISEEPSYISFTVANLTKKTVPVKGTLDGETPVAEGYLAGTMTFEPAEIEIKGPEELVNRVDHVLVVMSRENLTGTVTAQLPYSLIGEDSDIIESDEIVSDVVEIKTTQPILLTKTVSLSVELIPGGGAAASNAVCNISPASVLLAGDPDVLSGVNQLTIGTIDLSEVIGSYEEEIPIVIPNGTENLSGETTATVEIELKGLDSEILRVTNIELVLPEDGSLDGMDVECVTTSLRVQVRAPEEVLDQIYVGNLRAVADLTGYDSPGLYTVPVQVSIDGYTTAGILNDYEVTVRISEPVTEQEPETTATQDTGDEGLPVEGEAPVTEEIIQSVTDAQESGREVAFWGES